MRTGPGIDLLRAFEVFTAIADTGSVTGAARILHVTQSAVSQQLKQLESEFAVTLVDRTSRPLRLTPAGLALRRDASELLGHADRLRAALRQSTAAPLPNLRLAVFSTLAGVLMPAILQEIVEGRIRLQSVSMMRGITAYSGRELLQREVDVVVTSNPLFDVEGLDRHELIHERFFIAAPRDLSAEDRTLKGLAARLPLMRYSPRTEAGRMIESHLKRHRLRIPTTYSFDSPEDLLMMVEKGHGWAVTAPTHVIYALSERSRLTLIELPRPRIERSITLIARAGELGDLPAQLAELWRRTLIREYLPRAEAMLGGLSDHVSITDGPG